MASPSIASDASEPGASREWFLRSLTRQVAEGLFSVVFPSDCRVCGTPLTKISRLPVCQDCLDEMLPIEEGLCGLCGERIFSAYATSGFEDAPRCALCQRIEPRFARAVAYGSYEGGLRELIHLLKYGGVRPAAKVLGRMMADAVIALEDEFETDAVVVIPVPLHRGKLHQRGFNQAELIARSAVKVSAMGKRLRLCVHGLERKRETAPQIGLTKHQRRLNLRGAFAVPDAELVRGCEVLLVDDVYTTGATAAECTRILLRAGAGKVWIATVARTLKNSAQHAEIRPEEVGNGSRESGAGEIAWARAVGQ